jgi:hypothetical protein
MVKKMIINKKILKDDKNSSKLNKRLKHTIKKLQLDKEKIKKAILAIKKINTDLTEKTNLDFFNNIYVNIIFKNPLDTEENKKFKNRFFKLPFKLATEQSNLKVCFINNDLIPEKNKNSQKNEKNKSNENENELLLEKLSLPNEEQVDILTNDEFRELLKKTKNKTNLNFIYSTILSDDRLLTKYKQILRNDYDKLDIYYYNIKVKKNELFQYFGSLIQTSLVSALLKNIDNKLFQIKLANCSMDNKSILTNTVKLIYKTVSWILESSQKHNSVKAIVLRSENSPPFPIYNELDTDDLVYFE